MPKQNDKLIANNLACHALEKFAARKSNRDTVIEGQEYPIKLKVSGTAGKGNSKVSFELNGKLTVGFSNPTGTTSKPKMDFLVAHLLALLPKTRRDKFLQALDSLGDATAENLVMAKGVIDRLSKQTARSGSIRFIEDVKQ